MSDQTTVKEPEEAQASDEADEAKALPSGEPQQVPFWNRPYVEQFLVPLVLPVPVQGPATEVAVSSSPPPVQVTVIVVTPLTVLTVGGLTTGTSPEITVSAKVAASELVPSETVIVTVPVPVAFGTRSTVAIA